MILPHIIDIILTKVDIAVSLRLLTIFVAFLMVAALSFKTQLPKEDTAALENQERSKLYRLASKVVYLPNWRNVKYVIWTLAVPTALFGYFVPYVHITKYIKAGFIFERSYFLERGKLKDFFVTVMCLTKKLMKSS